MASSKDFYKKKYMTFTRGNVQRAVWDVGNSWGLGAYLGVPDWRLSEIERQFSRDPKQEKKAYIDYFMAHDPLASWRSVIVALDGAREKEAADKIRHLAEDVAEPSLSIDNLRQVTTSVRDWYRLGHYYYGLGVPRPVLAEIRVSPAYRTEEEKREASLLYFLRYVPMASWARLAGALHYREEKKALQAVQVFLTVTREPSLTPENLSSVLDIMSDEQWDTFGATANVPESERERIRRQYSSDRERKQAIAHSLLSNHPAPSWTLVAHTLYQAGSAGWGDESCHKALDHLQQQFPTGRYRSQLIYQLEMKRGFIELAIDKLVFFGIAGSGKTSVLATLLGVAPPSIRCSTPLLKRPIEVVFLDVDGEKRWTIRTLADYQKAVAEVIRSRMPEQETEAGSSAGPASPGQPTPQETRGSTSAAAETSSGEMAEDRWHPVALPPGHTPGGRRGSQSKLDSVLRSTEVDEGFVSLINSAPTSRVPILRLRQLLALDSGGQPEYLEMMPVFLNGASKFAYVFKVHESLDTRATIRYFRDGELVWEFPAALTNEATLRLSARTMTSLNAKNPDIPPAKMMFLATHRDLVADGELPKVLAALHKRLREILLPAFKEQLIYCDTKGGDFIFPLNAAEPGKEDREWGKVIREALSKEGEGGKVVRVPLRWHALYQKLLQVSNELGKKVLPRELCGKVAESLEIDEESCGEAVNFFHGLNMLFYFPAILPGLVFMEPQMLLDKVSELVDETYHMRNGKGEAMWGDRLKFRDHAQVTEKFLSKFETHYEPPLFTAKELVTLLKGLLVFAELSQDVYFMPCLLQVVSLEEVAKHRVSGEQALAVHFPDSGPLMGMFCSTVAYLLSPENSHPCPWTVVQNEAGTPKCLHRNVIKFSVSDFPGTVSLVDHFTHFELHVHTHPKKAARLWGLAHEAVFAGLRRAGKTIGYTNHTPVPAIVCPCSPTAPPHPATVSDGVWTCSKTTEEFGDVAEDSIPWLSLCPSHTAESSTVLPVPGASPSQPPPSPSTATAETSAPAPSTAPLSDSTVPPVSTAAPPPTPGPGTKRRPGDIENTDGPRSKKPRLQSPPSSSSSHQSPVPGAPESSVSPAPTASPASSSGTGTKRRHSDAGSTDYSGTKKPKLQSPAESSAASSSAGPLSHSTAPPPTTGPLPSPREAGPTLPDLLRLKVPAGVGTNYTTFGVLLLDDKMGSRVDSIENQYSRDGERITRRILQEWLEGKGLPVTWETLVQTLTDSGLSTLADQILATKL